MATVKKDKGMNIRKGKHLTREIIGNLLAHYRLTRGFKYIASEVPTLNSADIAGVKKSEFIEIEVKISKSDLKNELKKSKHTYYRSSSHGKYGGWHVPNKYYICVPGSIVEDAIRIAGELNPLYGVISFSPYADVADRKFLSRSSNNLHVVKKAGNLVIVRAEGAIEKIKEKLVNRMSSEIANLRCRKGIIDG